MDEKGLVRKMMKWLAEQPDCWAVKVVGSPYGRRGVPDILLCCRGFFVGAEIKVADGQPTESQRHELGGINRARGIAIVANSVDQLKAVVEGIRRAEWKAPPVD